jgi:O-methyltransferase involved in polyketide biosynthesis
MPGAALYEIDAPMVLAFKDSILAVQGTVSPCDRRTVTADLLGADWPTAGFDPAAPTAWPAEGLFLYLTDTDAHDRSAAGEPARHTVRHRRLD